MNKTYYVHGFNVKDKGAATVCTFTPYISPHKTWIINHSYGRFGLFQVLFRNSSVAKKLAARMKREIYDGDKAYAIGHSNGCAIILRALNQGAKFESILLINPALNIKTRFPDCVKRIIVVHTEHDKAVRAARFFDSIPIVELMIPDAWGAMGQKGYGGDDPRVHNIDLTSLLDGHSALFSEENLALVGSALVEELYDCKITESLI